MGKKATSRINGHKPGVVAGDRETRVERLLQNIGKTLGRFRRERHDGRISQTELAKDIGITQSYLSQVEAGVRGISIPTLLAICDRLGVSLAEVVIEAELADTELSKTQRAHVQLACAIIEETCPASR